MNIDEAISKAKELIYDEQGNFVSYIDLSNDVFDELTTYEQAIETLINEYSNLKQIEEAHRIENGELREENEKLNAEVIENICYRVDTEVFEKMRIELKQEKEKIETMNKGIDELTREKQDLKTELYMNSVSKDKIRDMKRYREFELQQEYKDFENDSEWKTYKKILEEE